MAISSDLIKYFGNGINAWANQIPAAARDNFVWCAEQLDDSQCDVYRAQAALDADKIAPAALIDRIYATLPTWGKLLAVTGEHLNQELQPETRFILNVGLGYLNVNYRLRTRTAAYIGHAVSLLDMQHYEEALRVINDVPARTPFVQLVTTNIYFRAQRWQDVIEQAQQLLAPVLYDENDQPTGCTDTLIQSVAYLMTGISFAHLGKFTTAVERLRAADVAQVDPSTGRRFHYMNVGAEVCYYLGLIARAKGDEDEAAICWNNGQAYATTDKLAAALTDPTIKLRQTTAELIKQRSSYWDVTTEPDLNEVRASERANSRNDLLAAADAELVGQIGMTEVKQQVRRLKASVALAQEMRRRGKNPQRQSMHLIFTGPPGTGKTTIARVVAKTYAGLGVSQSATVLETSRADFIGNVEGATTMKTRELIEKVGDGILFVDEAYQLVQDRDGRTDPFGTEAITELLLQMENRRDSLIVILAGYEKDINRLLATNDGLSSRFSRRIRFHSYTPEEVVEIAARIAKKREFPLTTDSRDVFLDETRRLLIHDYNDVKLLDKAGNGRFARNVVEAAEEYHAERLDGADLASLSDEELSCLTPEDVLPALRGIIDPLMGRPSDTSAPEYSYSAPEHSYDTNETDHGGY